VGEENRPTVFHVLTTRGTPRVEAMDSHILWPIRRGGCRLVHGRGVNTSLLAHGFNHIWLQAVKFRRQGIIDYFLLHHDDIEVKTPGWVDLMVDESQRVGAAVLSAVVAIKDDRGETSTAVETANPWMPRKLTLAECAALPPTFSAADVGAPLLTNTGVMLVDLRRPEFSEVVDGCLAFRFHMEHRVRVWEKDGELDGAAQVQPEDWHFARQCNARGLPVFATTAIETAHHGEKCYPNRIPEVA
jgi:hypothetical protein